MRIYCSRCGTRVPDTGICPQCGFVHQTPEAITEAQSDTDGDVNSALEMMSAPRLPRTVEDVPDLRNGGVTASFRTAARDCLRHPYVSILPLVVTGVISSIWANQVKAGMARHATGVLFWPEIQRDPAGSLLSVLISLPHQVGLPVPSLDLSAVLRGYIRSVGLNEMQVPLTIVTAMLFALLNGLQWRVQQSALAKETREPVVANRPWASAACLLLMGLVVGYGLYLHWYLDHYFSAVFSGVGAAGIPPAGLFGTPFPADYWAVAAIAAILICVCVLLGMCALTERAGLTRPWWRLPAALRSRRLVGGLLFAFAAFVCLQLVVATLNYALQQVVGPMFAGPVAPGIDVGVWIGEAVVGVWLTQGLLRIAFEESGHVGVTAAEPAAEPSGTGV